MCVLKKLEPARCQTKQNTESLCLQYVSWIETSDEEGMGKKQKEPNGAFQSQFRIQVSVPLICP